MKCWGPRAALALISPSNDQLGFALPPPLQGVGGAIYFASIVILQALLHGVTGTSPGIALVFSTLLIAALFQPLRRQLQSTIDRRFYREKYDAARVVDQFSVSLAQKGELDDVTSSLLDTVEQTMHPVHVSLWIRTPDQTAPNSQLLSR